MLSIYTSTTVKLLSYLKYSLKSLIFHASLNILKLINLFNLLNLFDSLELLELFVSFKVVNCVFNSKKCRSIIKDNYKRELALVNYFHLKKLKILLKDLLDL